MNSARRAARSSNPRRCPLRWGRSRSGSGGFCPTPPSWRKRSATICRRAGASCTTIPRPISTCSRTCRKKKEIGKPHSHGSSWAIYGNAREYTEMTEWRRTNPESEAHAVLQAVSRYRLGPGETKAYGPGVIHSTAHPKKAWVIRVTGTDLDVLPRYHFGKHDRILAQA